MTTTALSSHRHIAGRWVRLASSVTVLVGAAWLSGTGALSDGLVAGSTAPVELDVPAGTTIKVDGIADPTEWSDARTVEIGIPMRTSVVVRAKHDQKHLLLLYTLNITGDSTVVFPEVGIDPEYDRGRKFMPDDWWFHVSGTDCEAKGKASSYANCKAEQPDWAAVPNFGIQTATVPSAIEMAIPFSKLSARPLSAVGLALCAADLREQVRCWPSNARLHNPSTWGLARLAAPSWP